jgi:hypothetical protein
LDSHEHLPGLGFVGQWSPGVPDFKSLAQSSNDGPVSARYMPRDFGWLRRGMGQGSREIIASRERFFRNATPHLPDTPNMISTIGSSVRLR